MKCLTHNIEVNYPCSSACPLYGDCIASFSQEVKRRVRTNADRIRAMSDEELAEFLSDFKDCAKDCLVGKGVKDCSGICATSETLRMWLQQPAEEDT